MNQNITTAECAFAHLEVTLLGRTIKGLRGIEFKKEVEKEHIYGGGSQPIDIMPGNEKVTGSIKLLGFEVDILNKTAKSAGYNDIADVPHEAIVISGTYRRRKTDPLNTITATGVAFTETSFSMDQNAKMREITLPWLAMNLDFQTQ